MAKLCIEPSTLLIAAVVLFLVLDVKNPLGARVSRTSIGSKIQGTVRRALGVEGELQAGGASRDIETQSYRTPYESRNVVDGPLNGSRPGGNHNGAYQPFQGQLPGPGHLEMQSGDLSSLGMGGLSGSRRRRRRGRGGNTMQQQQNQQGLGAAVSASAMDDESNAHLFQGTRFLATENVGSAPPRNGIFNQSTHSGNSQMIKPGMAN